MVERGVVHETFVEQSNEEGIGRLGNATTPTRVMKFSNLLKTILNERKLNQNSHCQNKIHHFELVMTISLEAVLFIHKKFKRVEKTFPGHSETENN